MVSESSCNISGSASGGSVPSAAAACASEAWQDILLCSLQGLQDVEACWAQAEESSGSGRPAAALAAAEALVAFRRWAAAATAFAQPELHVNKLPEAALGKLHDTAWAMLHSGRGDAAKGELSHWREAFAACCLMCCTIWVFAAVTEAEVPVEPADLPLLPRALKRLDLGLIVAGPEGPGSDALLAAAEQLSNGLAMAAQGGGEEDGQQSTKRRRREEVPQLSVSVQRPARELPRGEALGLEHFLLHHLSVRSPVVLRGGCEAWPAVARWAQPAFWRDSALGHRFVPVEMDYWMSEGFRLMSLREFLRHCCDAEVLDRPLPGLSGGGYLAQHALLDQIPSLAADVPTPDLALCGPKGELLRQIFFGPRGTVTPLHHDPYENIFCQVVGAKYLRLYPPAESHRLYARHAQDTLSNNSAMEPADLLEGEVSGSYTDRFPEFLKAAFVDVILEPGDQLYLPRGWWHYVKSLSMSISVAFHFN
eukprot:TRINITY_DN28223_c0_g1_i1.p1 TRINITY_DN28223_c0_g1~~TRINITY_DN28223_c0_g1_i1.p1  ORF type:complete len:479 (+),score=82.46 TRINITY_DN28223_c0_g1_i1:48-1484(+)